jgi:hypothetical protein
MRGMFAGWFLLLASPIAMADEDPPSTPEEPAEPAQIASESYDLDIKSSGQYVLNGAAITRTDLRALIQSDAGRTGSWRIDKSPLAASYALSSITDLLAREGVSAVEVSTVSKNPPVVTELPGAPTAPTIMVTAAAPFRPIGDVRFGGAASGLGSDEALEVGFVVNRAAVGAAGQLGEHISTSVLLEAVENRDESSTGFLVRPRDANVSFPLVASGQLTAKVGIQAPVFGVQPWFNDDVNGFYTVSRSFQSVVILSGIHGPRVMGAAATAKFSEDRGTAAVMVSNTGNVGLAEDNNGKDISGRLQYTVADPVTIVLSGRSGTRSVDDSGRLSAGDAVIRIEYGAIDGLIEGVIGVDDDGSGAAEVPTFIGSNIALAASVPLSSELLDSVRISGRLAFFDPSLATDDADAWLRSNVGLLVRWQTADSTRLLTGLGYDVYTPIDATLPVNHRALVETHWQF